MARNRGPRHRLQVPVRPHEHPHPGHPTNTNPFLITFTYYAHAKTYTDQFTSPTYLEQGALFPISYNPLAPQQNNKSTNSPATRTPLFAIAVAGSILFSVLYLATLRGCN